MAAPHRDDETDAEVIAFPGAPVPAASPHPDEAPRLRVLIGGVLRDERRRQDRSLTDVADEAAVSVSHLSDVERGRKEISSDLLTAVTGALDLELVDVLTRSVDRLRVGPQRHSGPQLRAA